MASDRTQATDAILTEQIRLLWGVLYDARGRLDMTDAFYRETTEKIDAALAATETVGDAQP